MDSQLKASISHGDYLDKLSILQIKIQKLAQAGNETSNLNLVQMEHDLLEKVWQVSDGDLTELLEVNQILWDLENYVRQKINTQEFLVAAQSIFRLNDTRAHIKKQKNINLRSKLVEVKVKPNTDALLLQTHQGAGDMLAMSGAVRYFARIHKKVWIFCKDDYLNTAKFMYRDLGDGIGFFPEGAVVKAACKIIMLGQHSQLPWEILGSSWYDAMYVQAGLLPSMRYTHFKVDRDYVREKNLFENKLKPHDPSEPYSFVHDDPTRNYHVDEKYLPANAVIVRAGGLEESDNIFDYCTLIEKAEQVHCIDSSFAHLIDVLRLNKSAYLHVTDKSELSLCKGAFSGFWTFVTCT